MKTIRISASFTLILAMIALLYSIALPITAQAGDSVSVSVGLHQSELVTLPKAFDKIIIGNREVAGVVKHNAQKISVIGHKIGSTNIRLMDGGRIVRQVNVTVTQDLPGIRQTLKNLFPDETVGVEMVNQSVALTGMVSNSSISGKVEKVVKEYIRTAPGGEKCTVLNLMQLRSGQQVMLRVRVGEIRRVALERMGLGVYGVLASGASVLGALEKDKVFKVLAEPTLTAISGKSAKFLAGGEFPVPIAQSGNTMSVDYKSFGVSVDFTPYVLAADRIRLDVASEVSELNNDGAIQVASMKMPGIATRRANTTVELAPGESFMIAGLMKNDSNGRNIGEVPALGNVPILSALFRSTEFQNHESELVIAVTPYLVDPVAGKEVKLPTDDYHVPNAMERLFFGRLESYTGEEATPNLEGQVGYSVQ